MCVTLNWVLIHPVPTQVNITRSYVCSRFYLDDPPGEGNAFVSQSGIPPKELEKGRKLAEVEPEFIPGRALSYW